MGSLCYTRRAAKEARPNLVKHLTLIFPGLIWPAHAQAAATEKLDCPALAALLDRAEVETLPPQSADDMLLVACGLEPLSAPLARLRAAGDGLEAPDVLCADPVHLAFQRDGMKLHDASLIAIRPQEADALIASLNETFADLGRFQAASPDRWYLVPRVLDAPGSTPLCSVIGRRIDNYLPRSPLFRRTLNEIQMLFHDHPVNQAREARGEPAINSVWIWGEGEPESLPPRANKIVSANPLARGIAQLAGSTACDTPAQFHAGLLDDETLIDLASLAAPLLALDVDAARAELARLERDWFAPIETLHARREIALSFLLPGDRLSARVRAAPPRRLRWFARRATLDRFIQTHLAP